MIGDWKELYAGRPYRKRLREAGWTYDPRRDCWTFPDQPDLYLYEGH